MRHHHITHAACEPTAGTGLCQARYIRISGVGNVQAPGYNRGFELDAIGLRYTITITTTTITTTTATITTTTATITTTTTKTTKTTTTTTIGTTIAEVAAIAVDATTATTTTTTNGGGKTAAAVVAVVILLFAALVYVWWFRNKRGGSRSPPTVGDVVAMEDNPLAVQRRRRNKSANLSTTTRADDANTTADYAEPLQLIGAGLRAGARAGVRAGVGTVLISHDSDGYVVGSETASRSNRPVVYAVPTEGDMPTRRLQQHQQDRCENQEGVYYSEINENPGTSGEMGSNHSQGIYYSEIDEGNSEEGGGAGARSGLAAEVGSAYYAVVPSGDAVEYGGGGRAVPVAAAAAVTYAILSDSASMYATPLPGNDPIAESRI